MKSKKPLPTGAAKSSSTKKSKPAVAKAKKAPPKSKPTGKHPGGRPTKYDPSYPELARKFCLLGADDKRLAEMFDVAESTINEWKLQHPEFSESIKAGKDRADATVAASMYHRAIGYSHKAVKIFADVKTGAEQLVEYTEHYPPDPTSCIFWLKNRQKAHWRDKVDHSIEGTPDGAPVKLEHSARFAEIRDKLTAFAGATAG